MENELPVEATDATINGVVGEGSRVTPIVEKTKALAGQGRSQAATQIDAAADFLHGHAEQIPGGERTTALAHKAADSGKNVAGYLRSDEDALGFPGLDGVAWKRPLLVALAALAIMVILAKIARR